MGLEGHQGYRDGLAGCRCRRTGIPVAAGRWRQRRKKRSREEDGRKRAGMGGRWEQHLVVSQHRDPHPNPAPTCSTRRFLPPSRRTGHSCFSPALSTCASARPRLTSQHRGGRGPTTAPRWPPPRGGTTPALVPEGMGSFPQCTGVTPRPAKMWGRGGWDAGWGDAFPPLPHRAASQGVGWDPLSGNRVWGAGVGMGVPSGICGGLLGDM